MSRQHLPRRTFPRRTLLQRATALGLAAGSAAAVPSWLAPPAAAAPPATPEVDPWSFLAGTVRDTFTADTSRLRARDLTGYVDRDAKLVRSVTGELAWAYGDRVLTVSTPRTRAAVGFLGAAGRVELADVAISCGNEYASITVTSLDGSPIDRSDLLLLQAVTEEQAWGWSVDGDTITGVGSHPIGIRRIDATVTFDRFRGRYACALDANGYVTREWQVDRHGAGGIVPLPEDALYTVVSARPVDAPPPAHGDPAVFVWWEGEDAAETNFPATTGFSPSPQERSLLSGGDWLTNDGTRAGDQPEAYARYRVEVPADGDYHLWVRKFWYHGPFRWRFGDGDWQVVDDNHALADSTYIEPVADAFATSPIDLRDLNEHVAGEHGFVRSRHGEFVLGNGRPVRFWGVNAGPDIVRLDPDTVDYLARLLAKHGVNLVRVHGPVFDADSPDLAVDRHYLDRLHYFVAAMRKAGIYLHLSFYFPLWLQLGSGNGFPGYDDIANKTPFSLLLFDPQFQAIYRSWARELLTTPNPYTGRPLAAEPAVAIVEVQNEDSFFFWTFTRDNLPAAKLRTLDTLFGSWLARRYGSAQQALASWGADSGVDGDAPADGRMVVRDAQWMASWQFPSDSPMKHRMRDQREFLTEHQRGFYADTARYFRDDLGSHSLVSPSNWIVAEPETMDALERYTYTAGDVVDRHDAYFSGPHEGYGAGWMLDIGQTFQDRSVLSDPGAAVTMFHRIAGYPQTVSETGWPNPNRFKAESVPLWAAYGALQGMGGVIYFALDRAGWQGSPAKFTTMVPTVLGQFPAYALAFRRGDIHTASAVVDIVHSLQAMYNFEKTPLTD